MFRISCFYGRIGIGDRDRDRVYRARVTYRPDRYEKNQTFSIVLYDNFCEQIFTCYKAKSCFVCLNVLITGNTYSN